MIYFKRGYFWYFFAAHNFPKSRETRLPFVEELAKFKHLLPKKLYYLANAPKTDEKGNKTIICFDKLNKKQYIASKKMVNLQVGQRFLFKINGVFIKNSK